MGGWWTLGRRRTHSLKEEKEEAYCRTGSKLMGQYRSKLEWKRETQHWKAGSQIAWSLESQAEVLLLFVYLFVFTAPCWKENPLNGFKQGCAMIADLELKHSPSRSAWVVAFEKLLECPHCSLHSWSSERAQQMPCSQPWGWQASSAFPRLWSQHVSPISFLSSPLGFHLYYYFLSHNSRSFS